eukprot:TRINITY_DN67348_c3_g1_i1.p1 TRINITY_DN67348_c3_g1~~TRINITY_DN67348_c3_g1_i1.p1  ORF type:complete len:343 (+),score=6.89 TRINITY_DN67348_c3_g1_i1:45-1073(+)
MPTGCQQQGTLETLPNDVIWVIAEFVVTTNLSVTCNRMWDLLGLRYLICMHRPCKRRPLPTINASSTVHLRLRYAHPKPTAEICRHVGLVEQLQSLQSIWLEQVSLCTGKFTDDFDEFFDVLVQQNASHLKTLNIEWSGTSHMPCSPPTKNWTTLTNLQKFRFQSRQGATLPTLLQHMIPNMPNLTVLHLHIPYHHRYRGLPISSGWSDLNLLAKHCPKLTELELDFSMRPRFGATAIALVCKAVLGLTNLKKFKLLCRECTDATFNTETVFTMLELLQGHPSCKLVYVDLAGTSVDTATLQPQLRYRKDGIFHILLPLSMQSTGCLELERVRQEAGDDEGG